MKNTNFLSGLLFGFAIGAIATYLSQEEKRNRLVREVNYAAGKVKRNLQDGYDDAIDKYYEVKEKAHRKYDTMRNHAEDFIDDTVEHTNELLDDIDEEVTK